MEVQAFLDSISTIHSFNDVIYDQFYTPFPDNWYLAVADIKDSTDAIRFGKYKEVNMAGACIIAAMTNIYKSTYTLPFLFGGDGTVIAIPDQSVDKVRGVLSFCQQSVLNAYGLQLRTGLIQVKKIRENGHDIRVANLRLSDTMKQSVFWGSGLSFAEAYIKSRQDELKKVVPLEADFSGLECRWDQIPSDREEIVAYIIQASGSSDSEKEKIYEDCFKKIDDIYGEGKDFHPVNIENLRMSLNPIQWSVEWKLHTQSSSILKKIRYAIKILFQLISGYYLMKRKKKTISTDWGSYQPDLIRHADYRKFGDGLRFVANGTVAQRMEFTTYLDKLFQKKKLAYGIHPSFSAMITCFVKNYEKDHIHFIDGTDGGYAKASQELKRRQTLLSG